MIIKQLEIGPMGNFAYLLADDKKSACAVIDPGWQVDEIIKAAEKDGLKITHILLTHAHFDHANGAEKMAEKTGAKIYVGELEPCSLKDKKLFANGDTIKIGDVSVKCIHTPGHTPGSACFLVDKAIFTGDTLFVGAIGRTDLEGSDPEEMFKSLQKLAKVPDGVVVYSGHNYGSEAVSTMGEQKKRNPYMQFKSVGDFLRM
ncbi:MAG: Zn-dependent hydrolase [Deltaproteobacteria bacterium CG11_big_fil_rev_8_21_14_0_20_49_13]|nr:MAG: Zn-dependent hydrolase [Deltaproteobacteria bacterium CG11_big_fil_rev_8_21_14_0_20_49_13]